jgi:hypothetical protein
MTAVWMRRENEMKEIKNDWRSKDAIYTMELGVEICGADLVANNHDAGPSHVDVRGWHLDGSDIGVE